MCYNYDMKLKHILAAYRVTVKGLVCDSSGKLLFVQERSDSWGLSGGIERLKNNIFLGFIYNLSQKN